MKRSIDLVIGMAGILRSGAAYVPWIQPIAGASAYILQDSAAAFLLVGSDVNELPPNVQRTFAV